MWLYNNIPVLEIDEKYISFVYLITNLTNNKRYVGKKTTKFLKRKKIKGKKKTKKILVDSDWREYYGSSNSLLKDIELFGKENFKREILVFCLSKGTASYIEAKLQFSMEVLENPDLFYNDQIRCRIHRSHIKIEKDPKNE